MNKSISNVLEIATKSLKLHGIENPSGDARKLLSHLLSVSKNRLTLLSSEPISKTVELKYFRMIDARKKHQPVSQIIGYRMFWGREFIINKNVLDPRPETEELIYHALKFNYKNILDLGTGSGVILITLLLERTCSIGMGVDIEPRALEVAKRNAENFATLDRARLIKSNWCEKISEKFDLIVCNPPYISSVETDDFAKHLGQWEPLNALFANNNGLAEYMIISRSLSKVMKTSGVALFEIGYNQAEAVSKIFNNCGYKTSTFKDMSGKDRVIKVTF